MTKRLLMCGVAILFAASLGMAQEKAASKKGSWSGWITDSVCGAKGANAKHADCAKKCVAEKGAKYVLYDSASQKTYELDNQEEAAEHVAHHVRVHGSLEGDTIHVTSITMPGAKKASEPKSGS